MTQFDPPCLHDSLAIDFYAWGPHKPGQWPQGGEEFLGKVAPHFVHLNLALHEKIDLQPDLLTLTDGLNYSSAVGSVGIKTC